MKEMLRKAYSRNLKGSREALIIILALIGILLFPSHVYSKYPILCKWEGNDRISIWVGGRKEIISKSTEGGETITTHYTERFSGRDWIRWKKETKKALSFKEKRDEKKTLIRIEVEVRNPDGSLIKNVVLDKNEIGHFAYPYMSPKENFLIYETYKDGERTLWADPLIKDSSPISVFTQEYDVNSRLSPDETKFAIITNDEKWGRSLLIVELENVSNPIKVTTISENQNEGGTIRSWSLSGTHIVYQTTVKAYSVSIDGTQKVLLTDSLGSDFFQWDEDKLYFIGAQMLLEVDILNPEKPRTLLKLPECPMWYMAELSPDKSKIVIIRRKPETSDKNPVFEIWWNYIYKNEPWKQLFEYELNSQKP